MAEAATLNLDELYEECANLRREFADLPEGVRSDEDSARLQSMFAKVNELDAQITLGELEERRANAKLAATAGGGARSTEDDIERRSLGEMFISEDMVKWALSGTRNAPFEEAYEGKGTLDQMLTRAVQDFGSSGPPGVDPSGAGYLLPVGQPIAPVPRQARLFLRDLFPKMTTTLAQIPYVQELNPTNYESASAVPEGGVKPNATLSFQAAKADPTVIAATLVISKQLFEDAQAVIQYINQRLPYLVRFKEDWEFLNGSGTWPDLQGVLGANGVLTQGAVNTDNAQTFGAAFAQVENHDGTPTAVVLNPTNAWNMFTKRAAGGSGTFDAGTPFSDLPLTVWGVPTYRTRAMALNTSLVGDFQLGGMIADREQVNVETYKERYAELNQILMVCEERVGLMIFRPDLFCNVTTV
jgi:HK97 family phage major capsid protein